MKKLLLLISVLAFNTASMSVGYAASGAQSEQRLRAQLLNKDKVRVIVTFKEASKAMLGARTAGEISSLKSSLRQVKRQYAQKRKASKHLKIAKEFKYLPNIVYDVDAQGLQDLLDDPTVTVRENRIARPSLTQSVKRVYPSQANSPYHGNNQWAVAVIDTGVNKNHPMLSGKVLSEACYSTTLPNNSDLDPDQRVYSLCPGGAQSSIAVNSGLDCATSIDGCGHGTGMAGIAAGNTTNHLGVAKDAKIIAIKVFSQTSDLDICASPPCAVAFEDDVMLALDRVYALRNTFKIAAVNLSLNFDVLGGNGTCDTDPFKTPFDLLRGAGIPTVVSTGNDGENQQLRNPSCVSTSFSVGATLDTSDSIWLDVPNSFGSNRSRNMDLFAPGKNIVTAIGSAGYQNVTGTSAAAAHVSGAWAAARHAWPAASIGQLENLIRSKGPIVYTDSGNSKRRLDLHAILNQIDPGCCRKDITLAPIYMLLLD